MPQRNTCHQADSKSFWQWRIILRTTGFLDFVQWLRLVLSRGLNWVGVFFPSPEDGNRSSFRNVVLSSF
jgi:hypothetical protein